LSSSPDSALALRYFEIHLLSLTGFDPQLFFCLICDEALEPVENYFHIADGGTLCPTHGKIRPNADPLPLPILKVLRYLRNEPWEKVAQLRLESTTHQHIEHLLLNYTTFILERQLKSVDFLRKLRRM